MNTETPITSHPKLPEGVPLLASFNDDRNRLSYYQPILEQIPGVFTPITAFFPIEGSYNSCPEIEYREVTRFMQEVSIDTAFVRGDYSSGKFDGEKGSKIDSHDPYDIETVVLEMIRQLSRAKRNLGGRFAVREWIPHDVEVRFFIRNGELLYWDSLEDVETVPNGQAHRIAETFQDFAWSVDFIRHEKTDRWYCIDMGLDGLYHSGTEWIAISEHLDESHSPEQYTDEMADPKRYKYHR